MLEGTQEDALGLFPQALILELQSGRASRSQGERQVLEWQRKSPWLRVQNAFDISQLEKY